MAIGEYVAMAVGVLVLTVLAASVALMLTSIFTPKAAIFSCNKTKLKGFLTGLYCLLIIVFFLLGFGSGGVGSNKTFENDAFPFLQIIARSLFVSAVLAIVFRPLFLWYWKINARLEIDLMIAKQNETIIENLKVIAASSEHQTAFFDRIANRQNSK